MTIAVITGANTGVGYAVAQELLSRKENLTICLACRNLMKAEDAKKNLCKSHPNRVVDIVKLDTSCVSSVKNAAKTLREKYTHIDYLYLNAGIMNVTGIDWVFFIQETLAWRLPAVLRTGEGLLLQADGTTADGLKTTFQTNLFGHFLLVKGLEPCLGGSEGAEGSPSQIIWTSSSNASRKHFSFSDLQHKKGKDAYSSSKFGMDILSVGLNRALNKKKIYSHTACPGLVMTNLTYGIIPLWVWTLLFPLICILRLFVESLTYSPSNGSKSLVWLSEQDPHDLDPYSKFQSRISVTGRLYVGRDRYIGAFA